MPFVKTEASTLKMSKSIKKLWKNRAYRDKITKSMSLAHQKPESKEKCRKAQEAIWGDPNKSEKMREIRHQTALQGKYSEANYRRWANPEYKERLTKIAKVSHNTEEYKIAQSKLAKRLWQNPLIREKRIVGTRKGNHCKPNNFETAYLQLVEEIFPGKFEYVGGGINSITIGDRHYCPDLLDKTNNLIIELFGTYWHKNDNPQSKIRYYKKYGYNAIVIWEHEPKDRALKRIIRFVNKHTESNRNDLTT